MNDRSHRDSTRDPGPALEEDKGKTLMHRRPAGAIPHQTGSA
ncbi:Hypothetical protein PROPAUS_2426 [Propionibacterium australiense]|uniref:Uncharacterized protein n=1 Tax=Propionibacterium australiense TaxID=119981 RepID=A0A383SAG7_9ACTN|nr:Hypothetical protein PROPAUS_2426 [Propionibacterium australiense]